jgi:hypothetical protein
MRQNSAHFDPASFEQSNPPGRPLTNGNPAPQPAIKRPIGLSPHTWLPSYQTRSGFHLPLVSTISWTLKRFSTIQCSPITCAMTIPAFSCPQRLYRAQERFNSSDPSHPSGHALNPAFSLFLPNCTLGPPSFPSSKFPIEGRKDGTGTTKSGGGLKSLGGDNKTAWSSRARSREETME